MRVETLNRTSVVARFAHGEHESLCHQRTTLVEDGVHGTFRHLARHRTEAPSEGGYDFAHPTPESEEATIEEWNHLGVVRSLKGSIFLPLCFGISALDVFALEIKVLLATFFVERGFYGEDDQLLGSADGGLSKTGWHKLLDDSWVGDVMRFLQLHVGARGSERGKFETFFDTIGRNGLLRVVIADGATMLKDLF